jgi:hypothetical protein
MESARAIWEVTAGIIPGQVDPEHTRRFGVTSAEWQTPEAMELLLDRWHQAVAYATYLQLLCANGREVNWVRVEFLWP